MSDELLAEAAQTAEVESATPPDVTVTDEGETKEPDAKPERTFTQQELDEVVQKRLAKETRRISKLAEVEAENRMLRQQMEQAQPRQQEAPQGAPQPSQFQDYDSYISALTDWKVDQKIGALREQSVSQQRQTEAQAQAAKTQEKLSAGASKYDDFEDVALNPSVPVTQYMAQAVAESDMASDIAYYLGSHMDDAARISRLSPIQQVKEIARLEAKLATPSEPTKAPKPISPISGGKAPLTGLDDALPMDEWLKRRNAQARANGHR